jgi:hypothetical protein
MSLSTRKTRAWRSPTTRRVDENTFTGILECLAHCRRGHIFPAVLAPFGQMPRVAYVVMQEADLHRCVGPREQDQSVADKEVEGCSVGY